MPRTPGVSDAQYGLSEWLATCGCSPPRSAPPSPHSGSLTMETLGVSAGQLERGHIIRELSRLPERKRSLVFQGLVA